MSEKANMREVEFLPERIRAGRLRRKQLMRQGYLLGICILAMAALAGIRQGRISHARAELAVLDGRAVNVQGQLAMIQPLEQQMAELMIKKRIDEELGSRTDCTAVLAELCHIMPAGMSLVSMDLKTVDVRADSAAGGRTTGKDAPSGAASGDNVRRIRLLITGLAPTDVDVANFIGQMSASPLFEDVNMGYVKTVMFRQKPAREFQASCHLAR